MRRPSQCAHPTIVLKVGLKAAEKYSFHPGLVFSNQQLSWQDHSGAPGQCANQVAHRENHLKLLLAPANAPGAASDKPRINSGATHPLDK